MRPWGRVLAMIQRADDTRFAVVIEDLRRLKLRSPCDPRCMEIVSSTLGDADACAEFLEWATHHPRWSFNVAEASQQVCAKPLEAAIFVLCDIVDELLEDDE